VASVWQQAGRAGRRGRPSVAVLVAYDAPLEQHFCHHPMDFFNRRLETRLPDVGNVYLLRGHLLCAAAELAPLGKSEAARWLGDAAEPVLEECRREGRVVVQGQRRTQGADEGDTWLRYVPVKGRKSPKEELNLRDIDPVQFKVLVRGNSTPLETLDQKMAFMRLHPGALYMHQRTTYFVEELDQVARVAWVVPRNTSRLNYYTECREHSSVILAGGGAARSAKLPEGCPSELTCVVRSGAVRVHWRMYGFRKRAKTDHSIMDQIDLSLPPVEYPTQAVWMDLPGQVLQPLNEAGHSVDRGGLHALEHAMIALAPLCCDLEAAELSCQHTRRDGDPNRYLLLLYETQKGGAGTATKVYAQWEMLLARAVKLLQECPCEQGCPNCIVIPGCGEYNHGLDKVAAIKVGTSLGFGSGVLGSDGLGVNGKLAAARILFQSGPAEAEGDTPGLAAAGAGTTPPPTAAPASFVPPGAALNANATIVSKQGPGGEESAAQNAETPEVASAPASAAAAAAANGHGDVNSGKKPPARVFKRLNKRQISSVTGPSDGPLVMDLS